MAKARKVATKSVSPFTLEGAKILQPKIIEAVKAALAPYGVTVGRDRYTYGERAQILIMLEGMAADGGEKTSVERIAFQKFHRIVGLKSTDLDKTFRWGNKTLTVVGLNTKKRGKRGGPPQVVKLRCAEEGRTYWGSVDMVRASIDKAEGAKTNKTPRGGKSEDDVVVKTKKVRKTKIRRNVDNTDTPTARRKLKANKASSGKAGRRISTF